MADCSTYLDSVGVFKVTLFENKAFQINRPNILVENEVNIVNYEGSGVIINSNSDPKWTRTRSLSANRKQAYNDVLNFNLINLTDENRAILKLLRESIYGFIMVFELNNGQSILFIDPVFLRNETIINYDNGSYNLTLTYSVNSLNNYVYYLNDLLDNQSGFYSTTVATCQTFKESTGVYRAVLYNNYNLKLIRPDISKPNEIHLINYGGGAIIIDNSDDPKWTRTIATGPNYKETFQDTLQFNLYGLNDENESIINNLYTNINGWILELQLNNGQNIIFPTPVYLNQDVIFDYNNGNSIVNISYSVPTLQDYLIKLNNLVFAYSFVLIGSDSVLGYTETGDPIIINN